MFKNAEAFIHYPRCQLKMGTETTPRRSWRKYLERCLRLVDFEVSRSCEFSREIVSSSSYIPFSDLHFTDRVFFFFLTHSIWGLLFNSTSIRKFYVHFPIFLHLDNTEVPGTSSVFFLYIHEKGSPCRRIVDLNFFPSPKKKVKQQVKVNASQESSRIYWRYWSKERLHCVCNWSPNIAWGGTRKLYLILEILEFVSFDIQKILYNRFWAF